MTTVELSVTGMHCAACASLIEEVLAEQPGLVAADVSLESARATVTYDDAVTGLAAVQAVISELGYGSTRIGDSALPPSP